MAVPYFEANHTDESKLKSSNRDRKENNLSWNYFSFCRQQVGLGELFYFSYLELADVSHECIFRKIHLFVSVYHQTIRIDSQKIFSCEIKAHFIKTVCLEHCPR